MRAIVLLAWPGLAWPAVYPPDLTRADTPKLLAETAYVRSLDETSLKKLVPAQSGLFFVGCPNCSGGNQENQLSWTPERPDEIYCRYCNHR